MSKETPQKVLITGSAGFIFSNVVLYMLQHTKYDIISVDKLTYAGSLYNLSYNNDIENKRHKFKLGDISDYDFIAKLFSIEKPDIVINGAAMSHVDNSITGPKEFITSNIVGTHSLLEAMRIAHKPQKFIQFSTDEVMGQIENGTFNEDSPLQPRSPYSASKASADLLCNSYIETYDLPIIITRCCNVFGGRQHKEKLIPKTITNLLQDKKIPIYGAGKNIREWIFIKDVFYALMTILENGKLHNIYNIGSGVEVDNLTLVKKILTIMNKNESYIEFVEDRLGHDFRYALNSNKLRNLGWEPKYEIDDALQYTIEWFIKNRWSWNG